MTRILPFALGWMVLVLCASAAAGAAGPPRITFTVEKPAPAPEAAADRTVVARLLAEAPVIDGRLDDAAWRDAAATVGFVDAATGADADPPTRLFVGRRGDMLYLAAESFDADPAAVAAAAEHRPPRRDQAAWLDDCVQFMFDTEHGERRYQAMVVNAAGAVADFDSGARAPLAWDSHAEVAVAVLADRWVVEMALPMAALTDPTNAIWGFNVVRGRNRPQRALFTWRRGGANPADAAQFGHLSFEGRPCYIKAAALGVLREGRNQARVAVVNVTGEERALRAIVEVQVADRKPRDFRYELTAPVNAGRWFGFDFDAAADETFDLYFALLAEKGDKPLAVFARRGLRALPAVLLQPTAKPEKPGDALDADVTLNVAREDLDDLRVTATLRAERGGETLAQEEVRKPESRRLKVSLATDGLAPGTYELRVSLVSRGRGLGSAKETFELKR